MRLDIVLNDLVAAAYATGNVYIKSDGTPWRPIVHIRDIIAAILSVLDAPREDVHNQAFNVGRAERTIASPNWPTSLRKRCRLLSRYAPGGGPDKRCYRVSCEKIGRVLPNFRLQWKARKIAQELYEAYRTANITAEDLEHGRYLRIRSIQRLQKAGQLDDSLHWTGKESATAVGG